MTPNRDGKRVPPGDGGYAVEVGEVTGSPVYHVAVPSAKSLGPLLPMGSRQVEHRRRKQSRSQIPLVPTAEELASLPRLAQVAFAERCAVRVKPVRAVSSAAEAALVIFETATIDTPLTAQLRCIRRDFNRLKRLALKQNWTDDTPVAQDVFGPLWPEGIEPHWATGPEQPKQ